MSKKHQTRLFPSEYDDILDLGKTVDSTPSTKLRCFMCGKYKTNTQGKYISGETTIPIFTCFNCIDKYGERYIKLGYDKM